MSAAFDSEAWRTERDAHLEAWLLGDRAAIRVAQILGDAIELWDDLVDGDPPEDPSRTFTGLFVELETNPCWGRVRPLIWPIMVCAINAWMDSNALARAEDARLRQLAFHLRNTATEILPMLAFAVGGWEHLRRVSPQMRRFFTHESYADWEPGA